MKRYVKMKKKVKKWKQIEKMRGCQLVDGSVGRSGGGGGGGGGVTFHNHDSQYDTDDG